MTQQVIDIGSAPDDGTGDPLRLSFDKTNENFTELYAKGATEGLWNYNKTSTDTTTAPVSGRFKTNSGDYRGATQIAINAITIQGIDRSSTLRTLLVGDLIQCQDSTNSAAWCRYSLQSLPVDHGTWFQLNVTFQTDGGVASGDNQEVVFVFTASSGSAAAGAPVSAEYVTSTANATLTAERVLTDTATVTWDRTTAGQIKANAAGGSSISTVAIQKFTASGTYTPTAGMKYCIIEAVGGGGGGGGATGVSAQFYAGGGGGSGSYSRHRATAAEIGASQVVTVGSGGVPGTGINDGAAGADTSVGTLCIAKGGSGGKNSNSGGSSIGVGGAGGVAGTGNIIPAGGNPGGNGGFNTAVAGGSGASSYFGGGVPGVYASASSGPGLSGGAYGAGGSGGMSANTTSDSTGGYGSTGIVIITEYI